MQRAPLLDRLGRPLRDLRISVTDRCNFRCRYCMPREDFVGARFLPRAEILSFEEIERLARIFVALGVTKLRLTGGEPLLRRELPLLVERLARFDVDLALTTNGVLLPEHASALRNAGLGRLTVSLDALDPDVFRAMTDAPSYGPGDVLRGIEAAQRVGFDALKINVVVRRGLNDAEVLPLARHFRGTGHVLRFIEYMDVGGARSWDRAEVVTGAEILGVLGALGQFSEVRATRSKGEENARHEVARRFRLDDGSLEVGLIESVSRPFCGDCSRARLAADGQIYTCLFASAGFDLRRLLRSGAGDEELVVKLAELWARRGDRYSELRAHRPSGPLRRLPVVSPVPMSYLGG